MTILEQARVFLIEVQPKGAAVYHGGVYKTIGAWRIVPGLFWFYEAGGDNTQHEHFIHVDEFRFDVPYFLAFIRDGELIGGVQEMDPDQKVECRWLQHMEYLETEAGRAYKQFLEELADGVYHNLMADLN